MTNALLLRRRGMMKGIAPSDTYLTFTANTAGSTIKMAKINSISDVSIEYSVDGGVTWSTFTVGSTTITLANVGDAVKMRGVNDTIGSSVGYYVFEMTGSVAASGDLTSLLNGVGGDVETPPYGLRNLFYQCTPLTAAPNLPSTTVGNRGYLNLFNGCNNLQSSPYVRATTLNPTALNLTFNICRSITSHHVATLAASIDTFAGNSACTSFRIDATTPPTIASSTITGLKSDCIIYVPAGSVAAYQAAQYWSARAAYIQANPNT